MFHLTTTPTAGSGLTTPTSAAPSTDAIERLRPLLRSASALDLQDHEGWARLRRAARTTLVPLIEGGRLPGHLTLTDQDAPVVVQRVIASAWSHATAAPRRRPVRTLQRRGSV